MVCSSEVEGYEAVFVPRITIGSSTLRRLLGSGLGPSERPRSGAVKRTGFLLIGLYALIAPASADECENLALSFDGVNDWVNIHDFSLNGDFTIEGWMSMGPGINQHDVLVGSFGPGQKVNFFASAARLFAPPDVVIATSSTIANTWTHYAITRSGSQVTLYYNGVSNATGSWTGAFSPQVIGRSSGGFFEGVMDEVRLWTVARSAAEILQNYDQTVAANSPGLIGYWNFDEDVGTQLVLDVSGSGNDGSLGLNGSSGSDDPVRVSSTAPLDGCGGGPGN
jgi:hypothetical protein